MSQPSSEVLVPGRVFGRYRIEERLGAGGMGCVFLAHDTRLDAKVAIKVPTPQAALTEEAKSRFFVEARSAFQLRHPNICAVHDVGEIEGIPYISMAYIEGHPLSSFTTPIPSRQAARVIRDIAGAIAFAHENGIVHRDLKPENILVDRSRQPIVMDFGLAYFFRSADSRLTKTGVLLGTPAYMSPEQVRAGNAPISPSTDIYSLGVILYELTTGRIPFEGPIASVLGQILATPPIKPSKINGQLDNQIEAICLKAMSKSIESRYRKMTDLIAALDTYLAGRTDQQTIKEINVPPPPLNRSQQETIKERKTVVPRRTVQQTLIEGQQSLPSQSHRKPLIAFAVLGVLVSIFLFAWFIPQAPLTASERFEAGKRLASEYQWHKAARELTEAINLDSTKPEYFRARGDALKALEKFKEALADYDEAVRLDPANWESYSSRGSCSHMQLITCEHAYGDLVQKAKLIRRSLDDHNRAIELAPSIVKAYVARGATHSMAGDNAAALADYQKAIELDDSDHAGYVAAAVVLSSQGQHDDALLKLDEAVRKNPDSPNAFWFRADVHCKVGRVDRALTDTETAFRLESNETIGHLRRAQNFSYSIKDIAAADANYQYLVKSNPDCAVFLEYRGGFRQWTTRETGLALADYNKAVELEPNDSRYYMMRGNLLMQSKDIDGAIKNFSTAINLAPAFLRVGCYFDRARAYGQSGRLPEAIDDCTSAIKLLPTASMAFSLRGSYYNQDKNYPSAIADYSEAIRLRPEHSYYYLTRGYVYRDSNDLPNAIRDATKVLELESENANNWETRASFYEDLGDYARALSDRTKAIELDPSEPTAYGNRATVHKNLMDTASAISDYSEAIKRAPDEPHYYYMRASLYEDRSNWDRAIQDATKLIEIEPNDASNYDLRSRCYKGKGENAKSDADKQKAAELRKSND